MFKSETFQEIFKALVKAQSEFTAIPFDKVNPHFKSKYASLNATFEMIKPVMKANGLAIIQSVESDEFGYLVESRLIHTSGEFIGSKIKLIVELQNMQKVGSATTYAKRYAAQSLLGICGDEDDDGNVASSKNVPKANNGSQKTEDKVETKKEYPKVAPQDFVLNLGSIKETKLGEIPNDKLAEIGSWLSNEIKTKPQDKKVKFYKFVYGQIKKVLEMKASSPPDFDEDGPPPEFYQQDQHSYPQESENPFYDFEKKKN